MTHYRGTFEEREARRLEREPMLRLVSSVPISIDTPFDENDVFRCVANILFDYGQVVALGNTWRCRGILWIPGLARGRWLWRRWGYVCMGYPPSYMGGEGMSLSVLFDAITGKLVRFRYNDSREWRWEEERLEFGQLPGGLIEVPRTHPVTGESTREDEIARFIASIHRARERRRATRRGPSTR